MAPNRRLTFDLDLETVQRIVQSLYPTKEVQGFGRLAGGSTEVYRIDLAGTDTRSLVLKIYPDEPIWQPAKETRVAGWLANLTPIVPRWLRVDESRAILPLRFALLTLLPGRPLRDHLRDPGIESVYRQAGELLRRLHAIPMKAYGYIIGDGIKAPRITNAEYMAEAFGDLFRRFRNLGGDADLVRRLEQFVEASSDLLAESPGPVLCHDDFHQGNLLALSPLGGNLRLSGLIDFGNARAADRLFDLAKALFCCAHEDALSRQPLLDGYGPIDHPEPERALWLYTLFHRASMWCWLTKLGHDATADDGPGGLLRDLHNMAR
ncbi:aminoglycoside phosphotransferase (APT) family kinase protein [Inquilinus ginsengisoli]|uniref:Aminoglycoside phosphotransferase (APT) family kinase protein n=1 Tax=Inquilinus ginsengisoli TaxID=363840 RepID=A0ABU1JS70_9PROT|nr:aminoglycoside phosphotransferase family protein [Inquilinus ginsengisoli]MDR6291466.1 aminoglycoside phosphotransferase (APT) family kinase protein [Inquilinus ginsengisoli]